MIEDDPIIEETTSVCPECHKNIRAKIFSNGSNVLLKKACFKHGNFEDIYWSNQTLYKKFIQNSYDKIANSDSKSNPNCPFSCGLCANHKTSTILANIDLTNRCNQKCPFCFANSAASGYLYEPAIEQIEKMMDLLRAAKPTPCDAVQFSGGEPTLYPGISKVIQSAKKKGFVHIQIATNGVKASQNLEFCKKLSASGLNTIYLQFDGLRRETYIKIRGYDALPAKLKAINNFRLSGLNSIVLVPTIVKGINDDEIGDIIKFAVKNSDIVKSINFQPVSFSGRINSKELRKQRITIPDVLKSIARQTSGQITENDFYPISTAVPISRFTEAWKKIPQIKFTVHPHCGAATYAFIINSKIYPITKLIEVDKFIRIINDAIPEFENHGLINKLTNNDKFDKAAIIAKITNRIPEIIKNGNYTESLRIINGIINVIRTGSSPSLKDFHRKTLFIGIMHFMDPYNFDIKRVQKCGIHYVTPDMRIIPFCSYNAFYREKIEKKFSKPLNNKVANYVNR